MTRLTLIAALAAATPAAAAAPEDAKLTQFFRGHLDEWFKRKPLDASYLGDRRFDGRLDDLGRDARKEYADYLRGTLKRLAGEVDYAKLSRPAQIDYEILKRDLERRLWLDKNFDPFRTDPRVYNTFISDAVFILLTQSTLPKPRNVRNAAARIGQIPRVVEQAKANLGVCPKALVEVAVRQNRGSVRFYESGIYALTGETPTLSDLSAPCKRAAAALKEYGTFLEKTLLPRAEGSWRIGKEKFDAKLRYELEADVSADELLAQAESEAARVRAEMYVVARQLWSGFYPSEPLPPDDGAGRQACTQRVLDKLNARHGDPAGLVADARKTVSRIKRFIRENNVLTLPDPDRCRVIEMPEFQRGFSVAYLNPAPPLDPKAKSLYAVSPPPSDWGAGQVESFMREYNADMLQILSIHEAYPGHYVQLAYSNRHPSLVRRVLSSGTFAEGWAVYTEQMMLDEGYGGRDLGMRLQQLKWYLRAVANAVLDHKMHCRDMTDADAMRLLTVTAFQTEGEALGKVQRSKQSSCQLSTYFAGRMAFYRLRQSVQRGLGERFDLAAYHEAALSEGTLPVKYLPELVRARLGLR